MPLRLDAECATIFANQYQNLKYLRFVSVAVPDINMVLTNFSEMLVDLFYFNVNSQDTTRKYLDFKTKTPNLSGGCKTTNICSNKVVCFSVLLNLDGLVDVSQDYKGWTADPY